MAGAPGVVFDPATKTVATVATGGLPCGWRGGVLLPDGRALLLPWAAGVKPAVYEPGAGALAAVGELATVAGGAYAGGCAMADGRVVFAPATGRDLVVWEPGCGVGLGRDVVLGAWWNRG